MGDEGFSRSLFLAWHLSLHMLEVVHWSLQNYQFSLWQCRNNQSTHPMHYQTVQWYVFECSPHPVRFQSSNLAIKDCTQSHPAQSVNTYPAQPCRYPTLSENAKSLLHMCPHVEKKDVYCTFPYVTSSVCEGDDQRLHKTVGLVTQNIKRKWQYIATYEGCEVWHSETCRIMFCTST